MSKKSPTEPTFHGPLKPDYLIARSQRVTRSVGIRSHSIFDGIWRCLKMRGLPSPKSAAQNLLRNLHHFGIWNWLFKGMEFQGSAPNFQTKLICNWRCQAPSMDTFWSSLCMGLYIYMNYIYPVCFQASDFPHVEWSLKSKNLKEFPWISSQVKVTLLTAHEMYKFNMCSLFFGLDHQLTTFWEKYHQTKNIWFLQTSPTVGHMFLEKKTGRLDISLNQDHPQLGCQKTRTNCASSRCWSHSGGRTKGGESSRSFPAWCWWITPKKINMEPGNDGFQ